MRTVLLCSSLLLTACATTAPPPTDRGGDLTLTPLADGVWLHRSFQDVEGFGRVGGNDLVVRGEVGVVLVDTAWTPAQTRRLLDWTHQEPGAQVTDVVITHGHADSSGGVGALPPHVRVHALPQTLAQVRARGDALPNAAELTADQTETFAGVPVELFFPGHGHAPDNLVVHLPQPAVLFGGCFVKGAESSGLGNTAEADLSEWPNSVTRTQQRFPNARVVVPGHGDPGDAGLLAHTKQLLESGAP